MTQKCDLVIIGGGHAAAACVNRLNELGWTGRVAVLGDEDDAPYDRTVLSKASLLSERAELPALLTEVASGGMSLDLCLGASATSIDLSSRTVHTANAGSFGYKHLLIATGASPRRLPMVDPALAGVHHLRSAADARRLVADLATPRRVVLIGGGVIGLETAASVRRGGHHVTVVESAERVLGRYVPGEIAAAVHRLHEDEGVDVRLGATLTSVTGPNGRATSVTLSTGETLAADLVVVGVGVVPRDELARDCGLDTEDGILVNQRCQTSDPSVYAAGDVARIMSARDLRGTRSEAWQAAGRQGEIVAANIAGLHERYTDVLWTWSDQYDHVVQMAGDLAAPSRLVCGDVEQRGGLLVLALNGHRLTGIAGISRGARVARAVRAGQILIQNGTSIDLDSIRAAVDDSGLVARLMLDSARDLVAAQ